MCGIVGYSGARNAVRVLLEGLSALEYRGYDSAGVSVFTENGLQTVKSAGRPGRWWPNGAGIPSSAGMLRNRPYPLGYARRTFRRQRPSARNGAAESGSQWHYRKLRGTQNGAIRPRLYL